MGWLAIWDGRTLSHVDTSARSADLSTGTIRLEMSLRGEIQVPVVLWQGRTGTARDLRILCRPNGAVCLEQGPLVFETDAGFLFAGETLELHYSWDRAGRADLLSMTNGQTGNSLTLRPGCHAPQALAEIVPLTPGPLVSVAHAGIASHPLPAQPLPGLAASARIDTPSGPVALCDLRPGMEVLTASGERQAVRWIGASEHMARGRTAPILLRAPYFGLREDILVSRSQRLLLSGSEVDYLFGAEQVLARVEDIRRTASARICLARPTVTTYHVLLDDHDCLLSGRCALDTSMLCEVLEASGRSTATLASSDLTPAWPVIDRSGAQAWLDLLSQNRSAAA